MQLCGGGIHLVSTDGLRFDRFSPQSGVVFRLTANSLRANRVSGDDPTLGPVRLGTLTVSATAAGEAQVVGTSAVTADL